MTDEDAVESAEGRVDGVASSPPPRFREKDWGRTLRRRVPIMAYVGPNGSGKSLLMVHDTLPTLDGIEWRCSSADHLHTRDEYVDPVTGEVGPITNGLRRVLSTVRILDARTGESHRLYERLTDWLQVLNAEHCDILFDEVTGIANARESAGLPVQVQAVISKQRKVDNMIRLTAPAFARMDKVIREVTQGVTLCKGMLGKRPEGSLWRQNRLFWVKTYDARDLVEFEAQKVNAQTPQAQVYAPRPQSTAMMWAPRCRAFSSYDTLGQVDRVGEVLDSGRCAHCGGRRSIPVCRCES